MRGVVLIVVVVALAVGATSMGGAAAASRPAKNGLSQNPIAPTWSPDGKQIAFAYTANDPSPSARYRIVRTSSKPGGKLRTVFVAWGDCCSELQWASSGVLLLNPSGGLKTLRAQGGTPKRIAFLSCGTSRNQWGCSTSGLILSPNREFAAVGITEDPSDPHSSYGIGLVKLQPGRDPVVLASPLTAEENFGFIDVALAFSPDGTQLVFARASWDGWNEGPPALMAISLMRGGSVPLAQSGIPGAALVPNDATQARWSPDGTWLAYVETDYTNNIQNLEIVPTNGAGTARVLASCSSDYPIGFSWSPSSNLLAYDCEAQSGESSQFMTVKPDGTDATNLLRGHKLVYDQQYFDSEPRWAPDATRLLFLARGRSNNLDHVWTVRANGSHLTRIG